MLSVGKIVFLREEHTNWLSITKWSALKYIYIYTLFILNKKFYLYICEYKLTILKLCIYF